MDFDRRTGTPISVLDRVGELLERGGFDCCYADVLGVYDVYQGTAEAAIRGGVQIPVNDPLLAVPAMAAVTEHLGFGVTVSLTYEQPYSFARRMTTLDHLTKGRVAWNIVTSYLDSAARNLGLDEQISHDERYEIAEEYLEVCYKLWEYSWEDDAVVRDASTGTFADPAKVHDIEHFGKYFRVPGVFLSEPSPQRTPVLYQAGASSRGRAFAAKHAEGVFIAGPHAPAVRDAVADIRRQAAQQGRDPQSVKFFSLVTPIVAETDELAENKYREYLARASSEGALVLYGGWSGLDLSQYRQDQVLEYVENDALRSAGTCSPKTTPTGSGHRRTSPSSSESGNGRLVGSPNTVADQLEQGRRNRRRRLQHTYATTPGTFEDFVEHVVPELRRRGRVRSEYEEHAAENLFVGRKGFEHYPGASYQHSAPLSASS